MRGARSTWTQATPSIRLIAGALIPLCAGAIAAACDAGEGAPTTTLTGSSAQATATATGMSMKAAVPTATVTMGPSSPQTLCNGTFSDGSSISVKSPRWLPDVPGNQTFCDFHTFAYNQFLWLVQDDGKGPRFLSLAPWYNLFVAPGQTPKDYPGGDTDLRLHLLDQQAGDDFELQDAQGRTVLFDIRLNEPMYADIQRRTLYSQTGFDAACQAPAAGGACKQNLWLPPNDAVADDSLELKTAWRDLGAQSCPASMFCVGRWGLVGLHLVQKSKTHGEWVWASFEHVDNDPDCLPGGSHPVAPLGPTGAPWAFFDPKTVPPGVMTSGKCDVTANPPQCNGDPRVAPGCGGDGQPACKFKPVNVCRTGALPAGGASAANCQVVTGDGLPNDKANNPGNVACLNATLAPQLAGPWQSYEMVGSLWVRGGIGPTDDFRVQIFQTEQPGLPFKEPLGFVHLANTTMETWLQDGSTGFDPFDTNAKQAGCFLCHNQPSTGPVAKFATADLSHTFSKIRTGPSTKLTPAR